MVEPVAARIRQRRIAAAIGRLADRQASRLDGPRKWPADGGRTGRGSPAVRRNSPFGSPDGNNRRPSASACRRAPTSRPATEIGAEMTRVPFLRPPVWLCRDVAVRPRGVDCSPHSSPRSRSRRRTSRGRRGGSPPARSRYSRGTAHHLHRIRAARCADHAHIVGTAEVRGVFLRHRIKKLARAASATIA